MSSDPKATVFYGIAYTDDDDLGDDPSQRVEDYNDAMKHAACPMPTPDFDRARADADPEYAKAWEDWRTASAAWKAGGCDIHYRGSWDYGERYVCVNASRVSVEWNDVAVLDSLDVPPDWPERLRAFCEAVCLPWREPKWLLVAFYG